MAYEPSTAARPGRLRAIWNRLRHPSGSTRDREPGDYRDAALREAGTYPGGAQPDTPRPRYSVPEALTGPGNAQPAGRPNGSDTLHVTADGTVHTEPQWSGLRNDERVSQPVRRDEIAIAYVQDDGSVLYPGDVRGLDTSGLRTIDLNRVPVGLAAQDGTIFPPGTTGASPPQVPGLRAVTLNRHAKYEAHDGRIFQAAEVSRSHPGSHGGVRAIEHAIVRGYVRETDGKVFSPEQAQRLAGADLREVNLERFDCVCIAGNGQIYSLRDAYTMHPRDRAALVTFETIRVPVGFVSRDGFISAEPRAGATRTDLRAVNVGYVFPGGEIYARNELPSSIPAGMKTVDLDRYQPNPPQSGIAAGAQTATFRPSPQQRHQQPAGPSSQQPAATPGKSAPPPAPGR